MPKLQRLERDIEHLRKLDRDYSAKILRYHTLIENLQGELSEAEEQHDRTVKEQYHSFLELQEKMEILQALRAGAAPSRVITDDQVLLVTEKIIDQC